MPNSKYSLFLDNISSTTRSADIRYEMERAGKVLEVVRDPKHRCALVEFDRADDAKYAWDKMDGFKCHGRSWKVDWANDRDFEFFEKKWTEGYSSKRYSRSRSRSPSRRSPSPGTPRDGERAPRSPSAAKGAGPDGHAKRSPSPRHAGSAGY